MSPSELLERHSSEELSLWKAFANVYDLPDGFFLAAVLGPAILAPYSKSTPKAEDLVPYFAPPRKKQTTADHKAFFASISRKAEG